MPNDICSWAVYCRLLFLVTRKLILKNMLKLDRGNYLIINMPFIIVQPISFLSLTKIDCYKIHCSDVVSSDPRGKV